MATEPHDIDHEEIIESSIHSEDEVWRNLCGSHISTNKPNLSVCDPGYACSARPVSIFTLRL
jgi:hypothetical protein